MFRPDEEKKMRILGLDVGERRIGIALSDPEKVLAIPFTVIERKGEQADFEAILKIAKEQEVEQIIIGIPRSLNGHLGWQAEKIAAFSAKLSQKTKIPIDTWDERLSTIAAEKALIEAGLKRDERKRHRDALAAALILQSYLDYLRNAQDLGKTRE